MLTWMAVKAQLLLDGCHFSRIFPACRLKWPGQRGEVLTHIQQLHPQPVKDSTDPFRKRHGMVK